MNNEHFQANLRPDPGLTPSMVDGSYWVWGYDSLGQVTSAKRFWSDGTPVAGQHFEYSFDTIGNRTTSRSGGDQYGANLRQASYSANYLNQYDSRSIPGFVDVQGSAHSNATVTLWGDNGSWSPTTRKGEYFRGELTTTNVNNSVWLWMTNLAVLNTATNDMITNILTSAFVPQTPEVFLHDQDGNLTSDGKWAYTWDAENRLISMESVSAIPNAEKRKLQFGYDSKWRRTSKIVSTNLNGTYHPACTNYFLYDRWNLIAVLDSQLSPISTFVWGVDLSGSLQGAGGVGGLLFLSEISNGQTSNSHATTYDGNGTVTALVSASTGAVSARYEYAAFGEVLRATGPMAMANPFRFSTKYHDQETGLLYYGYRYYDPSTARWNSRDPIEEQGGICVYGLVNNCPVNEIDLFGMAPSLQIGGYPAAKLCVRRMLVHIGIDDGDFTSHWAANLAKGHVKVRYRPNELVLGPKGILLPATFDLEKAKQRIAKFLGSACIEKLTIGGHGYDIGHYGQVISSERLTNSTPFLDFLKYLSTKMCSDKKSVELKACSCAEGDKGREFIVRFAEFMKAPVIGYDAPYGPWPQGGEWRATPGEKDPAFVRQRLSYEGSMAQFVVDRGDFFRFYGQPFAALGRMWGEDPPLPPL